MILGVYNGNDYICKPLARSKLYTMVNTEEFTKRLHSIMDYYDLSAASFADRIDVGRSSISHLLSGRNKPSLDFVMKIITAFPEVELYWLLNGKGSFPKGAKDNRNPAPASLDPYPNLQTDLFMGNSGEMPGKMEFGKKQIQKIVIFYADGSFEAFEN